VVIVSVLQDALPPAGLATAHGRLRLPTVNDAPVLIDAARDDEIIVGITADEFLERHGA
jgi:hypothetical protein